VDDVSLLIEATVSHTLPDPPFPDALPVFLDLDLLVLGASRPAAK
jgi:predicted metal-dependent HD superfamily phosphohydrolase